MPTCQQAVISLVPGFVCKEKRGIAGQRKLVFGCYNVCFIIVSTQFIVILRSKIMQVDWVKCGNPVCSKTATINPETVFCQHCGSKYADFNVNIKAIIQRHEERLDKIKSGGNGLWVLRCML